MNDIQRRRNDISPYNWPKLIPSIALFLSMALKKFTAKENIVKTENFQTSSIKEPTLFDGLKEEYFKDFTDYPFHNPIKRNPD